MKHIVLIALSVVLSACAVPLSVSDYDRGVTRESIFKLDQAECEASALAYQKKTGYRNAFLSMCRESRGYKLKQ